MHYLSVCHLHRSLLHSNAHSSLSGCLVATTFALSPTSKLCCMHTRDFTPQGLKQGTRTPLCPRSGPTACMTSRTTAPTDDGHLLGHDMSYASGISGGFYYVPVSRDGAMVH